MKLEVILVQVRVNLKLGIIIIKSYSHRIDEIATDLSNKLRTKKLRSKFNHEMEHCKNS